MTESTIGPRKASSVSRRHALQLGAVAAGAGLMPGFLGQVARAYADDKPPLGTWPAGSQGDSVTIGAAVPRTGAYAVQGEDELKGMQLAVEHINEGNDLIKQIAPKVTKGLLGKQVKLVVADSAAKPNNAVQEEQVFINENKIIAMTGSTSSAVAVALNKFAQREKILYLVAISGSNDTTGKDCSRYSFRQCFYGETAANAIGPVLLKNFGKGKKAAFMTPDYTYGHTVTKSMNDYLSSQGGWTMVTNQVSPLGTQDFSQYLTNIANSGAEFIINVNWGRDAVLSVQQAKQFGLTPQMKMVIPYQNSLPRQGSRPGAHRGRLRRHRLLVDPRGQVPARQDVRRGLPEEVRLPAGVGRREQLHAVRDLGADDLRGWLLLSPGRHQAVRERRDFPVNGWRRALPPRGSPVDSSRHHRPRQGAEGHEEQGGLLGSARSGAGRTADAEAGRLRLQARRLSLTRGLAPSGRRARGKALS